MATQYTPILQLALPVTGELNGTWGEVVNDNITSMVEEAIAGLATISTWTANAHTLTTANGTTDEARCAMLVLQTGSGGTALSAAGQVICPDESKLYVVKNDAAYAVTVKTSGGSGVAVAAGDSAFVFCDGTNVNACVTQIINGHITGNLTVDGNANIKGNTTLGDATSDTITATARFASDVNPSADNTYDLGTSGNSWRNLYIDGTATIASLVATTADINGGTIDATTIGATTPSTGVFTQVDITAQGDLRLQDTTGGQYVALQAPGTVPASYTLTFPDTDGDAGQALITDGSGVLSWSTSASGDVYGPASATDNAVARFDTTTGKLIQNSVFTIADDGASVLSVNSSSDGLRITQIGAGNALTVEDSANPDSSPTVIGADGSVVVGGTGAPAAVGAYPKFSVVGTDGTTANAQVSRFSDNTSGSSFNLVKSRGATVGANTIVQSGDTLGLLRWGGNDGANAIEAAQISAAVDGTPGINDMPGRLVFSTTADGASSPTERLRINSYGNTGSGGDPGATFSLNIGKTITGGTNAAGIRSSGTVQSDVTANAFAFSSIVGTAAASFTLSNLHHYRASPSAFGAGSTVTTQIGYMAESTLTGATNNYGFYSGIASGTGRYNFYAAGTADNYMAGRLGIGGIVGAAQTLKIQKDMTGSTGVYGVLNQGAVQSDVTSAAWNFFSQATTAAAAFTLPTYIHYIANQGTIGAGSAITAQYGFLADATLTGATNNFGFRGDIAAGANRYNFYAGGTADNYFSGFVGVGSTGSTGVSLGIAKNITGATSSYGTYSAGVVQSDVTTRVDNYISVAATQATAFTLTDYNHFRATSAALGAGSTITNQYGFVASSALTTATNNYGFKSDIASGANRYNFYASGSATNYFAGQVTIGGASLGGYGYTPNLQVSGSSYNTTSLLLQSTASASAYPILTLGCASSSNNGIVANNDTLGEIRWYGGDSASAIRAAVISAQVDGTPGVNDMPGRMIFATTADGASSPTERMRIDNVGRVGIGVTPGVSTSLTLGKSITGSTAAYGISTISQVQSDVTGQARYNTTYVTTAAAAFTLNNLWHYAATQGAIGAGSTVNNQMGFYVENSLTGATNNYGFYSNIASGTGRYNFYAAGSADNYFGGKVGIGVAPNWTQAVYDTNSVYTQYVNSFTGTTASDGFLVGVDTSQNAILRNRENSATLFYTNDAEVMRIRADGNIGIGTSGATARGLYLSKAITGAVTGYGIQSTPVFQSDVTSGGWAFYSGISTQATAFTLGAAAGYVADNGSVGAGSTITTQYGFWATSALTTATNNYGFYSSIAAGSGRYNFYAGGSADNYFAGSLGLGGSPSASSKLYLAGTFPSAGNATRALFINGEIPSTSTSFAAGIITSISTQAASFTAPAIYHCYLSQGTIGAGSTVTSQFGVYIDSSLTGATNNYGFYSNIASSTGRYNFYAAGSAANYFAGDTSFGADLTLSNANPKLFIGTTAVSTGTCGIEVGNGRTGNGSSYVDLIGDTTYTDYGLRVIRNNAGANANSSILHRGTGSLELWSTDAGNVVFATSNTERMRITSAGALCVGTTSAGTGTIVDVQSTTAGVRFPNMTTAQKTAITPAAGTVVFDTTLAKLCVYTGAAWQTITSV